MLFDAAVAQRQHQQNCRIPVFAGGVYRAVTCQARIYLRIPELHLAGRGLPARPVPVSGRNHSQGQVCPM